MHRAGLHPGLFKKTHKVGPGILYPAAVGDIACKRHKERDGILLRQTDVKRSMRCVPQKPRQREPRGLVFAVHPRVFCTLRKHRTVIN